MIPRGFEEVDTARALADQIMIRAVPINILVVSLLTILTYTLSRAFGKEKEGRVQSLLVHCTIAWLLNVGYLIGELGRQPFPTFSSITNRLMTLGSCLTIIYGVQVYRRWSSARLITATLVAVTSLVVAFASLPQSEDHDPTPHHIPVTAGVMIAAILHAAIHIAAFMFLSRAIRNMMQELRSHQYVRHLAVGSLIGYAALQILVPISKLDELTRAHCDIVGFIAGPALKLVHAWGLLAFAVILLRESLKESAEVRLVAAKKAFIAETAHELITPASALIGWSEEISRHRRDRQLVLRTARAMSKIARGISALVFAASERLRSLEMGHRDAEEPKVVCINTICELATAQAQTAREKKVRINRSYLTSADVHVPLWAIVRCFVNLLTNAMHVTPYGGEIVMTTRPLSKPEMRNGPAAGYRDYVAVDVRDHGQGVPLAVHDRVFEKGFSTTGGSGLGLYLTRRDIEASGGWIVLQQPLEGERGARFTVVLPRARHHSKRPKVEGVQS